MSFRKRKTSFSSSRRDDIKNDNVHRWLISYADYMTLMFALFVVLYAMAMVNEKPFDAITESLGRVFVANEKAPKNRGQGNDILHVNNSMDDQILYGDSLVSKKNTIIDAILENTKTDLKAEQLKDEDNLSNVSNELEGVYLTEIKEELNTSLYELLKDGLVTVDVKGDWLEIELSSGLLFPSGSSSLMLSAKPILESVYDVLGPINNFVRIRGYTDNQSINTEVFASNWELSVYRATAVLRVFESLAVDPARMAIEGYGQYYPIADNSTPQGRAKNRRVVIAVSKYGIQK
jgi:chemotaxis protein MotB